MKSSAKEPLRVGVDFDNTIVSYDNLFHKAALELELIPADLPKNKGAVRDYLRSINQEDEWTRLQGTVYGARMAQAKMFPGVMEFFKRCRDWGATLFIISHKTKSPYLGPHYDLHQSARDWIESHGFYDPKWTTLTPDHVFFELSKESKMDRIVQNRCSVFLDDLPEFLTLPDFPAQTERVLFDTAGTYPADARYSVVKSWDEFSGLIARKVKPHG